MISIQAQRASASLMDSGSSEDWVRRSQAGDVEAFDLLVGEHYDRTFRIAYRILGQREAAEDSTQETFLKAWKHLPRFKGRARFSTWLHSIAVRHALDMSKSRKIRATRWETTDDGDALLDGKPFLQLEGEGWNPSSGWDQRLAVRDALLKLPEKQREIVSLYYYADYTLGEIADVLNLPVSTVYQRLRAGVSRLQKSLRDWGSER
jgi:RNA polymerase sigma-70 factor (ECF subfamily)